MDPKQDADTRGVDTGTVTMLEELWKIQGTLSARAGVNSTGLGMKLREAESAGAPLSDALRLEVGRALKLYIDNWSWSGMHFYLSTGKFL